MDWSNMSAAALGQGIERGEIDPRELMALFLNMARLEDLDHRIYVKLFNTRATQEAAAAADRAKRGLRRHPLDGVPISWKDLYDIAGEVTAACSPALADRRPATDAETVRLATQAGLVALGKTTMTELAFSGLGINPSFGTPANPFDTQVERVPGGSSSGAAVSVARGLAAAGLGSDTGGSVRIPAAWNGLVGLKTTAGRISTKGCVPLSRTLDTVGPLTRNVEDANLLFSLLAREEPADLRGAHLRGAVIAKPQGLVWEELDPGIEEACLKALQEAEAQGARVIEMDIPELDEIHDLAWDARTPLLVAEAYAEWGETIAAHRDVIFHPIADRIAAGERLLAADIIQGNFRRADIIDRYLARTAHVDAVAMPTVCSTPPAIADLIDGGPAYAGANRRALRNTTIGNQLGLCALTLPVGKDDAGIPVGLMLQAAPNEEYRLLRLGAAFEALLS